jgi:hypothetical protein
LEEFRIAKLQTWLLFKTYQVYCIEKSKKPPLKIRDGFDTWLIELFILNIKLLSQNVKIKGGKMDQHEIQNLFGLLSPVTFAERSRSIQPILNRLFD